MSLPPELSLAMKTVYESHGWSCENLVLLPESKEYGACCFTLNGKRIQFRIAKITPTKNGQFVTLWKRIDQGPIMPFDLADPIELFIIHVQSGDQIGQFVFPKILLQKKDIVSEKGLGGKRAIRVYPPWDKPTSAQATKTQAWQLPFFFWISPQPSEFKDVQRLFLEI